jgi:hypothetical protein
MTNDKRQVTFSSMALFGRETPQDEARVEAWRRWFVRQHPLALVSAVLSIFSLTHFGTLWLDEIAGIVIGVIAIRSQRRSASRVVKMAYVGIAIGVLSLICAVAIYTYRPG